MSRSGYSDGCDDQWQLIRWRGQVASAIRGKRGQKLLRDLVEALDAMPEKRLITNELTCENGVCALGAVAVKRGIDVSKVDPEDAQTVAAKFDIAYALACEIVFENDEGFWKTETAEQRWQRMRDWAVNRLREET